MSNLSANKTDNADETKSAVAKQSIIKRIFPLLGIVVVIATFFMWAWAAFGSVTHAMAYIAGQRLMTEPKRLVIDVQQVGQTHSAALRVYNLSNEPINIVGVASSCTCTSGGGLPVELRGGESQELNIVYKFNGDFSEQSIQYFTDSEMYPSFSVKVIPNDRS